MNNKVIIAILKTILILIVVYSIARLSRQEFDQEKEYYETITNDDGTIDTTLFIVDTNSTNPWE